MPIKRKFVALFFMLTLALSVTGTHLSQPEENNELSSTEETDERLDNSQLAIINNRLGDIENSVSTVNSQISVLSDKIAEMQGSLSSQSDSEEIRQIQSHLTEIKSQIASLNSKLSEYKKTDPSRSPPSGNWLFVGGAIVVVILIIILFVIHIKKKKTNPIKPQQHLVEYINNSLARGYNEMQIRGMLHRSGYGTEEVNQAFHHAQSKFNVNITL